MTNEHPFPVPRMVEIPAGDFVMGETAHDKFAGATERPAHRVKIPRPFLLARFPVTIGEYHAFDPRHASDGEAAPPGAPAERSETTAPQPAGRGRKAESISRLAPSPHHSSSEENALPVVNVSWDDASAYCEWLSRETGRPFRLPTEAEWEYACRAGSREPFAYGPEITPRDANFLHDEYCVRIGPGRRTLEGAYPPNTFGLHDMHGNVCEWVQDAWHPDYIGAPHDGSSWLAGPSQPCRVIRGGAWDYMPRLLRAAWRDWLPQSGRRDNIGFRVARALVVPQGQPDNSPGF